MSDEMVNETADDLTITYEEDGIEVVKELSKEILTKGAWVTVMYKYQEWDQKLNEGEGDYGPIKFTIRRYQKRLGQYKQRSKFNITNEAQASKIIAILIEWCKGVT